jgi:hypothetical protein
MLWRSLYFYHVTKPPPRRGKPGHCAAKLFTDVSLHRHRLHSGDGWNLAEAGLTFTVLSGESMFTNMLVRRRPYQRPFLAMWVRRAQCMQQSVVRPSTSEAPGPCLLSLSILRLFACMHHMCGRYGLGYATAVIGAVHQHIMVIQQSLSQKYTIVLIPS